MDYDLREEKQGQGNVPVCPVLRDLYKAPESKSVSLSFASVVFLLFAFFPKLMNADSKKKMTHNIHQL